VSSYMARGGEVLRMSRVVIFANGVLADMARVRSLIHPSDMIVCADGGTQHALALGLQPDTIIGDLDSMSDGDKQRILDSGIPMERHSHDKNETDLELALRFALRQDPSSILIIAALGRRLDHTLGNLALLADPLLSNMDVRMDDGLEEVWLCHRDVQIQGQAGEIVSLLPWGGPVEGVSTTGLKWPLSHEPLYPERTRGISNELLNGTASVHVDTGLLLIIHRRQTQPMNRAL
jgi:thiamine pyrophosphokinase